MTVETKKTNAEIDDEFRRLISGLIEIDAQYQIASGESGQIPEEHLMFISDLEEVISSYSFALDSNGFRSVKISNLENVNRELPDLASESVIRPKSQTITNQDNKLPPLKEKTTSIYNNILSFINILKYKNFETTVNNRFLKLGDMASNDDFLKEYVRYLCMQLTIRYRTVAERAEALNVIQNAVTTSLNLDPWSFLTAISSDGDRIRRGISKISETISSEPERAADPSTKSVKAVAKTPRVTLPTSPPDGQLYKTHLKPNEDVVEFIKRVYGEAGYLTGEFTRADLRKVDPSAAVALNNWEKGNKTRPKGRAPLNLPTVAERNDRYIAEGEIVTDDPAETARRAAAAVYRETRKLKL